MNIITDNNFEETINGSGVVVIDCWAEWCAPCKAIKPILEELDREMNGVRFGEIDVGENHTPIAYCGICSLPTILIYKDGLLEQSIVGMRNKEKIRQMIMEAVN